MYDDADFSQEACAWRRQRLRDMHPENALDIAVALAKEFRERNEWCQRGRNRGQCLLAADELSRYLEPHHIKMTSVQFGTFRGQAHAWLEVWDKRTNRYFIVDPTADQFGEGIPEVVSGLLEDLPDYQYEDEDAT